MGRVLTAMGKRVKERGEEGKGKGYGSLKMTVEV